MQNYNSVSPESLADIPVDGVDADISCAKCPSACCRTGTIMQLSKQEALFLEESGTDIQRVDTKKSPSEQRSVFALRKKSYELQTDCANLAVDEETGESYCNIYTHPSRPRVCGEFRVGSYACGLMQIGRHYLGQDQFVGKENDTFVLYD